MVDKMMDLDSMDLDSMLATTEVIGQINSEPPSPERSIETQTISRREPDGDITAWVKEYAKDYKQRVKTRKIIEYTFEGIDMFAELVGIMMSGISFDRYDKKNEKFNYPVTKAITLEAWETLKTMPVGEMTMTLGDEYNLPAYDAWSIARNATEYAKGTMPKTTPGPLPASLQNLTNSFFLTGLALGAVIGLSQGSFDSTKYPAYVTERLMTVLGGFVASHDDVRRLVSMAKGTEVPPSVFCIVCSIPGALERTKKSYAGQAYTGMLHPTVAKELPTINEIRNWRDAIIFIAARKYTLLSPVWGKSNPFNGLLTGKRNLELGILCVRASNIREPITVASLDYSSCATRLKEGIVDMYAKVPEATGEALIPLAKKLMKVVKKKARSPHILDNFVDDCKDNYFELAKELVADMESMR